MIKVRHLYILSDWRKRKITFKFINMMQRKGTAIIKLTNKVKTLKNKLRI